MTSNNDDVEESDREILRHLSNEMRRVSSQTKNMAHYLKRRKNDQDSEEEITLAEWQPIQTQYVSSYLEKCISRMNLHEESARYYTRRHYIIVIPATAMGVITSTTAFSQWSSNVLCGQTSWVMLLVGGLMALTTLLHNLSEFVFAYKDKARQHQQSYINFSRLVKRISNEYNNPVQEHIPYRQFIASVSEDYDRYTEHALMVPASVDKMLLNRWIKSNEMAKEKDQQLVKENQRNSENRIVQQSTISTAIDAATISSTAAAMKTISGKAEDDRVNEALEEYRKNRRMSAVPLRDDIVQDFKMNNPLNKLKKGEESVIDVGNDVAAARYGIPSSSSSRRESIDADYVRRSNATSGTQGETRRPSLVELMQQRRLSATAILQQPPQSGQQRRRQSVVQFVDEPLRRNNGPPAPGSAAAFAQRSSILQKATAKFQSDQSKNIPFDSMIELNAISSSTSSASSNSPPKTVAMHAEYVPVYKPLETSPDELEKGNDPDPHHHHHHGRQKEEHVEEPIHEEEPQQIQEEAKEEKVKRRKKKKVEVPLPETRDSQFAALKYNLEFEKRNSFPRRLSATAQDDDEEDVTPDDVASHVFGQVTYDEFHSFPATAEVPEANKETQ